MAFRTIRLWTFCGLVGAFIDLALAYLLLCGSACTFFASKFCDVFGLFLPCPCTGLFGYQNSNICFHRLLIDWPMRKIFSVQILIKSKFPFDLVWFENQPCNLEMMMCKDRNCDNEVLELDDGASSSSFPSPKLQNLVDRESGYDAKGKKIVNHRQKHGVIRRRKRSALVYGKSSARVVVAGGSDIPFNGSDMRSEIGDCPSAVNGKEDGLHDDGDTANGLYLGERTWYNIEKCASFENNKVKDNDSSYIEKLICSVPGKSGFAGNEENTIRILKEALKEEKAACTALQLELEKERAAAATAADEAMAMILRLQADKAAIEMEARQYQRMIEEKFEYEEEEMNILKEILVRREKENHFLEKEVEAYRQMKCLENGQSEVDFSHLTSQWGEKPLYSLDSNEDLLAIEKNKSVDESKAENTANWSSTNDTSSVERTSDAAQTCNAKKILSCCGNMLEKDGEHGTEVHGNLQCPKLDLEPIVYDVHVIDDKTEFRKEENCKSSGLSNCAATYCGASSDEVLGDCTSSRIAESEQNNHSSFDMQDRTPELDNCNLQSKNLLPDMDGNSSSASSGERLTIDSEVELLGERLRKVEEGREKLTFSADHEDIINAQLKLVEEIVNHLEQIRQLREPTQQDSLHPPSSKVSLKRRRCRSMPLEWKPIKVPKSCKVIFASASGSSYVSYRANNS